MKRIRELRILSWQGKLVYATLVFLIGWVPNWLIGLIGMPDILEQLFSIALIVGFFLLGARWFRVEGEAVVPPRAWWRMTGRAKLSRRLGILFTVLTVLCGISAGVAAAMRDDQGLLANLGALLGYGALAYLYLDSAIRLRRVGDPERSSKRLKFPLSKGL